MTAMSLTRRLHLVQPPDMRSLQVLYLAIRRNKRAAPRWYFQPKTEHKAAGWNIVRLHDKYDRPIVDGAEAAAACNAIVKIYQAWQRGEPGNEPSRIDDKGRVLDVAPKERQRKGKWRHMQPVLYRPGMVGAIIADYRASDEFIKGLGEKSKIDYGACLDALGERFGTTYWQNISRKQAKAWIMEKHDTQPSQAHQWYRTVRAVFNKTQLIYDDADHPGYVPEGMNPFAKLDIEAPKAKLIVWPVEAVTAGVAIADEMGRPSLGDAITFMYWIGTRRQDWMRWAPSIFDTPYLAWETIKTKEDVTIQWDMVPELKARIDQAKARVQASAVRATTFFFDDATGLPWQEDSFFFAFNDLRDRLTAKHPSFKTRYAVKFYNDDPMRLPTGELTMRTLRHTCITALHDAGASREQIRAVTGHSLKTIDDVLDRYTKLTVDQSTAALTKRLAWEGNKEKKG